MLLGFASNMRFNAMDVLAGCWNTTLPPAPILKEDQFSVAVFEVCETDKVLPLCTAVALPEVTKPAALVPQLEATQGTGNGIAAVAFNVHGASTQTRIPLPRRISGIWSCRALIAKPY